VIDIVAIKGLIHQRCGLRFENHTEDLLADALLKRQEAMGLSERDYYHQLSSDATEFQSLVNLLTINETYFYRELGQLRLVTDVLAVRMLADRSGGQRPLRIFSAGCSSGEEAYSLAMLLHERFGAAADGRFQVLAGDIDEQALARARRGVYGAFSFRALDTSLRSRYFTALPDGNWQIRADLQAMVSFFHFNFLGDRLPEPLQEPVDIIVYRNVSIYFDRPTRESIIRRLVSALSPKGHLIVGSTETLSNDFGLIPQVAWQGGFYFSLDTDEDNGEAPEERLPVAVADKPENVPTCTGLPPLQAQLARLKPSHAAPPAAEPVEADLVRGRRLLEQGRHREALQLAEGLLRDAGSDADLLMLAAQAHHRLQADDEAGRLARQVLQLDHWQLDALLLMGNLARAAERWSEAIGHYKQAVYHLSECWPARYQLADCYVRTGQTQLAGREYRVLKRQLAEPAIATGLSYFRVGASPGELLKVVDGHLQRLGLAQEGDHGH
jgi:chemotaxis protein methyltransferase CheR